MALSVQKSCVCYDLAYGIVEKWLISFSDQKNGGRRGDLGFDFLKIMMMNRQIKGIFLRLFEQNFGRCELTLGLFDHNMRIYIKENDGKISALLFRDIVRRLNIGAFYEMKVYHVNVQMHEVERDLNVYHSGYGTIRNKWIYAFLLFNDISLFVSHIKIKKDLLENKENFCSFDLAENPKESLLHFIYHGEDEFENMLKAGVRTDTIHKFLPTWLDCFQQYISDPSPEFIQRLFNLNANRVWLSIELTLNVSLSNAFPQLNQPEMMDDNRCKVSTQKLTLFAEMKEADGNSHAALSSPDALWRSIALFALQVCPELKTLYIVIIFCFPTGEFQESLLPNLTQLFDWFKQEIVPKLPSDADLKLKLEQRSGFRNNNRLLEFLLEQNFSVVENDGDWLSLSYNADSRLNLNWCYNFDDD